MVDYNKFETADFIAFIIFGVVAVFLALKFTKSGKFYVNFFLILAFVHLIALIYGLVITGGTDARKYFRIAAGLNDVSWIQSFGQASDFIYFFTYPLISFFKLSYSGCYFIYATFGLTGYFFLIKSLMFLIGKYNLVFKRYYFYILLLPGLHVWNIALGKDSLMFFSITLFFYGVLTNNWLRIIVGAVIMGLIRSPILALFIVGIVFGNLMLNKKISFSQKLMIVLFSAGVIYFMLPYIQERLKLDSVDYDSISAKIDERLSVNQLGGSSIDMSKASMPEKLFGFLFRPLFYDAHSGAMLYSSCENIVWLILVISVLRNFKSYIFNSRYFAIYLTLFLSFLIPVLAGASVLSNLGIAVRIKTMYFTPLIMLFFLSRDYELRKNIMKKRMIEKRKFKLIEEDGVVQ